MKILLKFLILFLVSFSFFTEALAQQNAERSKVVETISGKKYYKHTIEKGQTLYSISKLYAIDQKIIEQENPELKDGFKIGQTLKIPFDKENSETTAAVVQDNKNNYVKHIVEKEQTLYSISKKYNVSIDDIKKLNPDVVNGIRLGQELTIPVLQTAPSVVVTKTQTTVTTENTNAKPPAIAISKEIVRIEGKDYLLHKVESGQTIYSIAKAYNVSKEELINNNPQLIDGLQLGQVLKIESKGTATVAAPKTSEKETDSYFLHKVEKGQTVNAIAVKYGCTTDDIFALNPDIVNGLKENAFIKVPKKKAGSVTFSMPQTSLYVKKRETPETINIGLFLPFYIAKNDSGKVYKTTANDETIYPKSIPAVEFYQGFLMAMDSINRTELKVKLFVYDFPSEPSAINKFLEKEELKNLDAIVGPFHSDDVTPAALFAKKNNIYLFAPLSQQSKALLGNPFLVKITPSTPTIVEQTAEYIAKHYAGENIFIVHNSMPKEKNAIEIFKTRLKERIKLDTLNEGIYKNEGIKGTYALMKKDKKNVIFFPSTDQAIVTDLINKLNTDKKNDIVLFGMDNWINYENLDIELMQNIHLHIPSIGNVNYLSDTVKNFIGKFRAINKNEPSRFAYSGYDSGILMMNLFSKKDTAVTNEIQGNSIYYLQNKLNNFTSEGLFSKFFFYQTSMDSGFENQGVYILRYEDYTLKNAE